MGDLFDGEICFIKVIFCIVQAICAEGFAERCAKKRLENPTDVTRRDVNGFRHVLQGDVLVIILMHIFCDFSGHVQMTMGIVIEDLGVFVHQIAEGRHQKRHVQAFYHGFPTKISFGQFQLDELNQALAFVLVTDNVMVRLADLTENAFEMSRRSAGFFLNFFRCLLFLKIKNHDEVSTFYIGFVDGSVPGSRTEKQQMTRGDVQYVLAHQNL